MSTDEHTITLGLLAETLMSDETFNELYATVETQLAKEILATPLADNQSREHLYLVYAGMRSFTQYINSYRGAKDQVIDRLNADHDLQDVD